MNEHQVTAFMDHILEHAQRYFPDLTPGQISVQLKEKQERALAILYRFEVKDGLQNRSVIVKAPVHALTRSRAREELYEKPVLFRRVGPKDRHWLQYTALSYIHEYFTGLGNKQFGTIRVLDYLPLYHAILTEESNDQKLQQLFIRESRLHLSSSNYDLTTAFQNAGTWLHHYHTMPKKEDVQVRHHHREEYFEAIIKLTDFLAKAWGDVLFFKQTSSKLISTGRKVLPELLPLGLSHGDYAMRNILIGPDARVTVLDTFAKWQTPIYEDIGYFLNSFKTSYPQVLSQGLMFDSSQLMTYEYAFLRGYFKAKSIPVPAIRLYEILALLDKWSSVLMHYHHRSAKLRTFGRVKSFLASRYFKKCTETLLQQLSGIEAVGASKAVERTY